jgi:hypothetical protein
MIRIMSEFNQALLVANIYRYLLIIAGGFCVYWGYRLFDKGYFEKGGELKATFGEHNLIAEAGRAWRLLCRPGRSRDVNRRVSVDPDHDADCPWLCPRNDVH